MKTGLTIEKAILASMTGAILGDVDLNGDSCDFDPPCPGEPAAYNDRTLFSLRVYGKRALSYNLDIPEEGFV